MLRVVADTNTVISGLLWRGKPFELLRAAERNELVFCTSPALLAELQDVLTRRKFAARLSALGLTPATAVRIFRDTAIVFPSDSLREVVITDDPDDDAVLACALAAKNPDFIVSGDKHLRKLKEFRGIHIITVSELLIRLS